MTFSPKTQFQKLHKPAYETLRQELSSPWLSLSIEYAFLLVASSGASREQIAGMQRFISALNDLASVKEEVTEFPVQKLSWMDATPEEQAKIIAQKKS